MDRATGGPRAPNSAQLTSAAAASQTQSAALDAKLRALGHPLHAMNFRPTKLSKDVKVYKNECAYCFATPESPGGLYVNLATLSAYCREHVSADYDATKALYLLERWTFVPRTTDAPRPKKLAIGMEGGFQADSDEVAKKHALVAGPKFDVEMDLALAPQPLKDLFQVRAGVGGGCCRADARERRT
jgi:hypothetical protein